MGKKNKKKGKGAEGDGNRVSVDEPQEVVEPTPPADDQQLPSVQEPEDVLGMFGGPNDDEDKATTAGADSAPNGKAQGDATPDLKSKSADGNKALSSVEGSGAPSEVKASSEVKTDDSAAEVGAADMKKGAKANGAVASATASSAAPENVEDADKTKAKDTEGSEAAGATTNAADQGGKGAEDAVGHETSGQEAKKDAQAGSSVSGGGGAAEEVAEGKEGESAGGADDGERKGYIGGSVVTWSAATANLREALLAALGVGGAESVQWAEAVNVNLLHCRASLTVAKGDVSKALQRLKALAYFQGANPGLVATSKTSKAHSSYPQGGTAIEFAALAETGLLSILSTKSTPNGETVVLFCSAQLAALEKLKVKEIDVLRYTVFLTKRLVADPAHAAGVVVMLNLKGHPYSSTLLRKSLAWLKASPLSLKGLYAVHSPYHMATLMAFLKPFLSIKLRNRTAMYGADVKAATTAAGLVEGVASLPVLYGGSLENFDPAWHLREDLPEGFTTNAGGSGVLAASAVTANPLGAFEEEDDDDDVVEKEKEESAKDEDASQAAASPPSETA